MQEMTPSKQIRQTAYTLLTIIRALKLTRNPKFRISQVSLRGTQRHFQNGQYREEIKFVQKSRQVSQPYCKPYQFHV